MEANVLRKLTEFSMFLDKFRTPQPLDPVHREKIPATISKFPGEIGLFFYAPSEWHQTLRRGRKFPVLLNFHAGGFTIGSATDDSRWASAVVEVADTVVVSVQYRLAPEYPFPTAIEDGVDALFYLFQNAERFNLDADRFGLSGFSSGGSMAFTVWLRFRAEIEKRIQDGRNVADCSNDYHRAAIIVSWYPSVDFATHTRTGRRRSNPRPEKELPRFLIDWFDACYIYPRSAISLHDPLLSPGVAPLSMLKSLPDNILILACEWDGLRAEAERFKERLVRDIGKRVQYRVVEGTYHAWDKRFRQVKDIPCRENIYREVCLEIRRIFYGQQMSS